MRFLLPQGIGDSVWALHKIQSISTKIGDGRIDVLLSGGGHQIETRALDFVRRFSFVDSAEMRPYSVHPKVAVSPEGYYNYIEDGMYNFPDKTGWKMERVCALMPNGPLERGIRLENWLPQYEINWDIWKDFIIDELDHLTTSLIPRDYAVFYLGPLTGNTTDGHNRGPLWKPEDWINLGRRVHDEFGLRIVAVGAPYDVAYFQNLVGPQLNGDSPYWTNLIGQTSIGQLYSITQNARFVVSYQSGVGIVSAYLGTPTAIWWRGRGDSISPSKYLSFDERMASAWASPAMLQSRQYFPMIYKRDGVDEIMEWARCVV
jgi:hypothetical protein